ncbi:MAG TPA: thiaminase II, partial [Firmicutes bacterium]|nr:thiaminase II [Bacillota bacterium]
NHRLWRAAQDHPFVHALADGSLDRDRFVHYLKQDFAYLQAYARAISIAAAKAPGLTLMAEFSGLAHETLNTEMQLHRDYCSGFDITEEQLEAVEASPVCRAYGDFCIATASIGGCAELLAGLIPCGVGYAETAMRLKQGLAATEHPYRRWIETYAGPEYLSYAGWMISAFDALAQDAPHAAARRLDALFVLGCRYEWLFWEMAWTGDSWPDLQSTEGIPT